MKLLLSPAKMMSLETASTWKNRTTPRFLETSTEIQDRLKDLSPSDLEKLLAISPKLAGENWERNQQWHNNPSKEESIQAILAFKGEVYRGLDAETLSDASLEYLNQNLMILSGLYGILSPSDEVMLYRLEMGRKLSNAKEDTLYSIWKEKLTHHANSLLKPDEIILNLASKEYSNVLDKKNLNGNLVEVDFKEYRDGKLKSIMVYFKHARGALARWCAENQIQDLKDVYSYKQDRYTLEPELTKANHLVFIR